MLICLLVGLLLSHVLADSNNVEQNAGDAPSLRPREKPRT